MASFQKYKKGWRVFIRRKGFSKSATFQTKREAQDWAAKMENLILPNDHEVQEPIVCDIDDRRKVFGSNACDLVSHMDNEDQKIPNNTFIDNAWHMTEGEIENVCLKMKDIAITHSQSQQQRESVYHLTKKELLNWGLFALDENGNLYPTDSCAFLLGKDIFASCIQCAKFQGNTRAVFLDKREYSGPLWQQIDDTCQFVLRNIRLGAILDGVYQPNVYELPQDSIRELIINAVLNCDFAQNSHIQVAIYDDRLEITSPGGLMPEMTLKHLRSGFSNIRNRALFHAFSYMNLITAWGHGIPKLIDEMNKYGLKEPEFIDMGIGFRVNLYRSIQNNPKF